MHLMADFIDFFAYRIMHVVTRKHLYYGILCRVGVLTAGFWRHHSEPYTSEYTSIVGIPAESISAKRSGGACFDLISIWGVEVLTDWVVVLETVAGVLPVLRLAAGREIAVRQLAGIHIIWQSRT
jgi:hypothetical protein